MASDAPVTEVANPVLATEVDRVFQIRGWSSYEQAALYTKMSAATLRRMRLGMKVKADTVLEFGVAIGEEKEKWARIAMGLAPTLPNRQVQAHISSEPVNDPIAQLGPDVDASILGAIPHIPTGVPASLDRHIEGSDDHIPTAELLPKSTRTIEVLSDIAEPMYQRGDLLFVDQDSAPRDGDTVIATVDLGNVVCGIYRENGSRYLEVPRGNGELRIDAPRFIVAGIVEGFFRLAKRIVN